MELFSIWLGKLVSRISQSLNLGAGQTWPGELVSKLDKNILGKLINPESKIIVIAGTNGKTTTAKLVASIIKENNPESKIVHNASGANLINGLIASLVSNADWCGRVRADFFIFEVDEATLPLFIKQIKPNIIVLLNLFRDQLDRYGEIDLIAEKWQESLARLDKNTVLVLNGDDPEIAFTGERLKTNNKYFGLTSARFFLDKIPHATDSLYCPKCGSRLSYEGVFISHLGKWKCNNCGLVRPKIDVIDLDWNSKLLGVYNRYNVLAAVLVAKSLGISGEIIRKALLDFVPAFGRQEEFNIRGKTIKILLSKNPTGLNETIRTVLASAKCKVPQIIFKEDFRGKQSEKLQLKVKILKRNINKIILLVLNDRIPDGRDVSWIWDADTEKLLDNFDKIIVSGDRAEDMGLRIKYSQKFKVPQIIFKEDFRGKKSSKLKVNKEKLLVMNNLKDAIRITIDLTEKGEMVYILPTYSAMLEVRQILIGRKIL